MPGPTRHRGRIAAALIIAAVVTAAGVAWAHRDELLLRWHVHRAASSDEATANASFAYLGERGDPRALPVVFRAIERVDAQEAGRAIVECAGAGALPWLHAEIAAEGSFLRRFVLREIADLGPDASPVAGEMLAIARSHPDLCSRLVALRALGGMGQTATDVALLALEAWRADEAAWSDRKRTRTLESALEETIERLRHDFD